MQTKRRRWFLALGAVTALGAGLVVLIVSCLPSPPEPTGELGHAALSRPTILCVGGRTTDCREVEAIREAMGGDDLTIVQAASAPGGQQGAAVLTLSTSEGLVFDTKWRSLDAASRYNDPLAELAADRLQDLILGPHDIVVPPASPKCFEHDEYERRLGHERAPFEGTDCVLGFLSLWLSDSMGMGEARRRGVVPGQAGDGDPGLYDPARFESDASYRRNLAHVNLVAFLLAHGDAHAGQFVVYDDPAHVFLVDNSVAFGLDHRTAMEDRQDLARLVVPAIPRDTAARLRQLTLADVARLRVAAELRVEGQRLISVREPGPAFGEPDERVRRQGNRVQLGLSAEEMDGVWDRVARLQSYLNDGGLGVF